MRLRGRAALALIGATLGVVVFAGGVATADDCGGPGPDIGVCNWDNTYTNSNDAGGGSDLVPDSWPPGIGSGSDSGYDGTPIVMPGD